jgi:type II secretory pathway pseudopilin PulG
LEVVVALAIVASVLVPLLRLQLLSLDATIRAQDLTTAVLLAQGRLAAMGTFPEPGEEEGTYEDPELARYRWQTTVTEHTFDAESGDNQVEVRRIEVTVRWTDGRSERHYTLEAYASQ